LQKYSKIKTGFSFLDQKWGGIYPGGNYFIFGSKKSGKTILALNILEHLLNSNYKSLLITSDRKKSLEIQTSSVYFDISESISSGILKVERINENLGNIDNIKNLITENNPSILIIDEIINDSLNFVREDYVDFIEFLEENDITSLLLSKLPTDDKSKQTIKQIAINSTAIIQLQKSSARRNYSGTVIIKPNMGHFEGEFESSYKIEPEKGFITLADNEESIYKMLSNLDDSINLKEKQSFEYTNIYSVDEFKFLIESRTALSSQTGENISIISYELLNDSIESTQLCDSLRIILEKGDKICFTDSMVYILPENNDSKSIQSLSVKLDQKTLKMIDKNEKYDNVFKKKIQNLKPNYKIV